MNLHDHHLRLGDLERAFEALTAALAQSDDAGRQLIEEAARELRARGAGGAAGLLLRRSAEAAYRR